MFASVFAAASALAMAAFAPPPARADSAEPRAFRYPVSLYLGGLKLGEGVVVADASGDGGYEMSAELEVAGIATWFDDTRLTARVQGVYRDGRPTPRRFKVVARSEQDPLDLEVLYADDAPVEVRATPPFKPKDWQVDPTKQVGAMDPLSAVLAAATPAAAGRPCGRTLKVFDARRRWDLEIGKERRRAKVEGGERVDCQARYRRIAGYSPRELREAKSYPFRVRYLVRADGSVQLLRAWADTDFGAIVAIVTH